MSPLVHILSDWMLDKFIVLCCVNALQLFTLVVAVCEFTDMSESASLSCDIVSGLKSRSGRAS